MVDVGADGQAVVKDQLGGVLGKVHAARQVLERHQRGVALLEETLEKPPLAGTGLGIRLKESVDGLVAASIEADVEQAALAVEHERQRGRRGMVGVAPHKEDRAAKRERQVVLENAVSGSPVLRIGQVNQAVVAGLRTEREVVQVGAKRAGNNHGASFFQG